MSSPFQTGMGGLNQSVKPYSPAPCACTDGPLESLGVGRVCNTSLLVGEHSEGLIHSGNPWGTS